MELATPFESLLIANRGEIAVRIARTCRELGIRSIAVYSDSDAHALHVQVCDEAVGIGGTSARDSYLRGDLIIAAAQRTRATALHPGYGFLSENADFAQACTDAGLIFVGPAPAAMRAVGDKIAAKKTAIATGVPVLPGYLERQQSPAVLREQARRIGTPLLIKAAAGGGGRGMRLVTDLHQLEASLEAAQREAQAAFGDATVFLERFVERPRHIEVQILADTHKTCIALGERECSIQRRYQKILEESPSPAVDDALRAQLEQAAINIATAVGYTNAGTVEFMLDPQRRFYFLEMNARLQVEHPVTEMVTGVDLVAQQLWIAAGAKLALKREPALGHAIEVRVYAEDPLHGFLPSTGNITTFVAPQLTGVRNDVAVAAGSQVEAAYDPMLAKLIVHATNRDQSVQLMAHALDDYLIGGVATNIGFLRWLVEQPAFKEGVTSTDFLDRYYNPEVLVSPGEDETAALAAVGALPDMPVAAGGPQNEPWHQLGSWQHSFMPREVTLSALSDPLELKRLYQKDAWCAQLGKQKATVRSLGGGVFSIDHDDKQSIFTAWSDDDNLYVSLAGNTKRLARPKPPLDEARGGQQHGGGAIRGSVEAPMSGTIVKVNVVLGETVKTFAVLMVMEAMKMEHAIVAPYPGSVTALNVKAGQSVRAGDVLAQIVEV